MNWESWSAFWDMGGGLLRLGQLRCLLIAVIAELVALRHA